MMNKNTRIVVLSALIILMGACSKEKFTTKPQLEFLSAENYEVPRGGLIRFYIQFTDKEGDLDDSLFMRSETIRCPNSNRNLAFPMPSFPKIPNVKGEMEVTFANGVFIPGFPALPSPACGRPDTTNFYFWLKDKAGNISDTVKTDKPLIIQN